MSHSHYCSNQANCKTVVTRMFLLLLLSLLLVAHQSSAAKIVSSKDTHSLKRSAGQACRVVISYYPLNEKQLMQAPGDTNAAIRSYYNSFPTTPQAGSESTFQVAVEYKKPQVSLNENRQVKIDWYNLLFVAMLRINMKTRKNCDSSYLGFVELVETDTAWYKDNNAVNVRSERWLADPERQYVMTKPSQRSNIFATDNSRVQVLPLFIAYRMPIKYESSENIVIDYNMYPETVEYERLIKKKVFLVHTDLQYKVLEVITGVDVMMYLKYHTDSITPGGSINLTLKKDHSLFQRIINPEKYVSVLNDSYNQRFRDINLSRHERFQSSPDAASLNPLPENINIVTQ